MSRYLVEEVKCGITEGGIACGPVPGDVIVTIKYRKDNEPSKWLSVDECTGIPNIFLNDRDVFEGLMENGSGDEAFYDYMESSYLREFEGISLGEYDDIAKSLYENENNNAVLLIRYLLAVLRCTNEETEDMINLATGKYIDEVDVPLSDIERDYSDPDVICEHAYLCQGLRQKEWMDEGIKCNGAEFLLNVMGDITSYYEYATVIKQGNKLKLTISSRSIIYLETEEHPEGQSIIESYGSITAAKNSTFIDAFEKLVKLL